MRVTLARFLDASKKTTPFIRLAVGLLMLLLQAACVSIGEAPRPESTGYITVPLKRTSRNELLVAVLVNGRPATFLVDTGAPHVGIEQARIAALGIEPLGGHGPQAPIVQSNGHPHRLAVIDSLQVGGITLERVPGVLYDLASVTSLAGRSANAKTVDGILGLDVLTALHAVVDCTQPALFIRRDGGPEPGLGRGLTDTDWMAVPMIRTGGHLLVEAQVGEITGPLVVDTGAGSSLLDNRFIAANRGPLSAQTFTAVGIHFRTNSARAMRLNRLSIGGHEVNSSTALVCNLSALIGSNPDLRVAGVHGLLGLQTLVAADVLIDCQSDTFYLRKRRLKITFGRGN